MIKRVLLALAVVGENHIHIADLFLPGCRGKVMTEFFFLF